MQIFMQLYTRQIFVIDQVIGTKTSFGENTLFFK